MLSIKDLQVAVEDKAILRGLNLEVARRSARHYGAERLREKYAFRDAGRA
jgi:hypothetical protein